MGKDKIYQIHSIKKYPDDLEALYDKFAEYLESFEIKIIGGSADYISTQIIQLVEIGPREGLSSTFQARKKQLKIDFVVQTDTLIVNLAASGIMAKSYKKMFSPYIIKSLNQAVRDLT